MKIEDYFIEYLHMSNKCKQCGAITKFHGSGFSKFCSHKCTSIFLANSEEIKKKKERTNLERYGTKYANQSKIIQEKTKKTNLERYGSENVFGSKQIQDKIKQTNLARYGVEHATQSKEIQKKMKQNAIKKYGVESHLQLEHVKRKIKETNLQKYGTEYGLANTEIRAKIKETNLKRYGGIGAASSVIAQHMKETNLERYGVENTYANKDIVEKIKQTKLRLDEEFMKEHDLVRAVDLVVQYGSGWSQAGIVDIIKRNRNTSFVRKSDISKIIEYTNNPPKIGSRQENEVADFIASIYDGSIVRNTRKVIAPLELDIYIPSCKLAIEFNGNYWHSLKDKEYHLNKTKLCEERGIRLIHITEWEWLKNPLICKSIIKSALGQTQKIYARKCIIKEVSRIDERIFLEENHLQGYIASTHCLGLYYKDELMQIITTGKSRFKKDEVELLRMCTKNGYSIVGGFSKLLSHINYDIVSYVDRSKFDGNSYLKNGFKFLYYTDPSYVYIKGVFDVISRFKAQKRNLKKLLQDFDPSLSEEKNMFNNGYFKMYNCGTLKLIRNVDKPNYERK